jgi:hypothetical protein
MLPRYTGLVAECYPETRRGETAMRFPKQRIRFSSSYDGRVSDAGYLLLDLKGLDIEGVTTLVIDMGEIDAARAAGDREDDARRRARELLGG